MTKKIVNCETGEEMEVELSAEDLAQQEIDAANFAAKEVELEAKEEARQSALSKLGLTADEFKALLG